MKKYKNNIHGGAYQGVAKRRGEIGRSMCSLAFFTWARGSSGCKGLQSALQPPKVEPAETGAENKAFSPVPAVEERGQ
jgi:hypothetical protein